jgi:hypothetical protein
MTTEVKVKMKKRKDPPPKFIVWPPVGSGKVLRPRWVPDKAEIARHSFDIICSLYPEFKALWEDLFNRLKDEELPLLIGASLPYFVFEALEDLLKSPVRKDAYEQRI